MSFTKPQLRFPVRGDGGVLVHDLTHWWAMAADQTLAFGRKDDWKRYLFAAWGDETPEDEDCWEAARKYDLTHPYPGPAPLPPGYSFDESF